MTAGRKSKPPRPVAIPAQESPGPLLSVLVASEDAPHREFGRRRAAFGYSHLFIPSLVLDYTFLFLRQTGLYGDEKFLVWAGSLAGGEAFVSTVVLPRARSGYLHGEIAADVVARAFAALDQRDLVPLAQVHSHPAGAALSTTDQERPLVAQPGFLSIIVPNFAFGPPSAVTQWGVYEYRAKRAWRAFTYQEKLERLVVDDSFIRID